MGNCTLLIAEGYLVIFWNVTTKWASHKFPRIQWCEYFASCQLIFDRRSRSINKNLCGIGILYSSYHYELLYKWKNFLQILFLTYPFRGWLEEYLAGSIPHIYSQSVCSYPIISKIGYCNCNRKWRLARPGHLCLWGRKEIFKFQFRGLTILRMG